MALFYKKKKKIFKALVIREKPKFKFGSIHKIFKIKLKA